MTTTDIRNESFTTLRDKLNDLRRDVLCDLATHGPCTTRQLATLSRRDILTVRPRVTELLHCGLVVLHDRDGGEGVYRVALQSEWEAWRDQQLEEQTTGQLQMM
jgi:predicted transcriptional regulator